MARRRQNQSDEELLLAAPGDERAFEVFYRRHLSALLAFFYRRTGDRELAADLAMETFASALLAAESYDPERSPAMSWLFMLAQRRLSDSRRTGRVEDKARRALELERVVLDDEDLEKVVERAAAAAQTRELAILEQLSLEHRQAIEGHLLNEESYAELAERFRCSEALVRQRVHRGLSQLRRRLRPL